MTCDRRDGSCVTASLEEMAKWRILEHQHKLCRPRSLESILDLRRVCFVSVYWFETLHSNARKLKCARDFFWLCGYVINAMLKRVGCEIADETNEHNAYQLD